MKTLATLSLAALLLSSTAVMAQSQQQFDGLDSDGDDKLSFSDVTSLGITQEQFDAADSDTDDFLDLAQFEALVSGGASTEVAATAPAPAIVDAPAFDSLDSDGDQKLSIDDLNSLGISQEQFDAADIDNDDFLDTTQYEGLKGNLDMPPVDASANVAVGMVQEPNSTMVFEDIDADGDGMVDFSDLNALGITQEQFDAADSDNDDFLDRTQFEGLNT